MPKAVALDPADRAFYVAYHDGSLQTLSFYDEMQQSTAVDIMRDGSQSHRPVQPSANTRFNAESQKLGGALSLGLSWDGTTLISGHESGKVASWDIAKGNYISTLATLPGPVTNLQFLAPTGWAAAGEEPKFKFHTVVKPRQDAGLPSSGSSLVSPNYSWTMQFTGRLNDGPLSATEVRKPRASEFEEALAHPSFPLSMLEQSLAELNSWNPQANNSAKIAPAAEFVSLSAMESDGAAGKGKAGVIQGDNDTAKEDEIQELKKQVANLQRIQKVTFSQLSALREEKGWFLSKEKERALQEQKQRGATQRVSKGDVEMSEPASSSEAASSGEASESDDVDDSGEEVV
jgi:pre-rRNA-processing protein IPI3